MFTDPKIYDEMNKSGEYLIKLSKIIHDRLSPEEQVEYLKILGELVKFTTKYDSVSRWVMLSVTLLITGIGLRTRKPDSVQKEVPTHERWSQ